MRAAALMKKYSHLLPNDADLKNMLAKIGCKTVDELFVDVPEEVLEKQPLDIPGPLTQMEVERSIGRKLSVDKAAQDNPPFLGGGIWPHYVPPAVKHILSRSEFYTSYTPYQPEISQGMLQALFEYQSMICDLTGMDAANASMYDWPNSAAEACRMAVRYTGKRKVLVAKNSGYDRRTVIQTYLVPAGIEIQEVRFDDQNGLIDEADLERKVGDDVAAFYLEQPNFFGGIESGVRRIGELLHEKRSLLIVGVEPTSLGILSAPGDYGADIVVGEGQPLGIPMSYGGPSLGIFAAKGELGFIRQMPGRIIGMTSEKKGSGHGFVMVLQTREQHIRRERATSNICTNQSLMAVAAAAYLALLGREGLRKLAKTVTSNSHYVAKRISETGKYTAPAFDAEFYSDFTVRNLSHKPGTEIYRNLAERNMFGAVPLSWYYDGFDELTLFGVTEAHTKEDVDRLVDVMLEVA
jgi:glycine dehydrogenase subunit 1